MSTQKDVLMISKMSVKGLGCKPVGEKEPKRLCRIFGKADGIKMGEDKQGKVWSALTGSFAGVNLDSGEEFRSGKLFLPSGIHETVENAVRTIEADGKEGQSVQFALEIHSIEASNPIGYSYRAINLVPAEAVDELTALRQQIELARDAKALPAPAATAEAKASAPAAKSAKK
jgi:hypothetical protein